MENEKKISVIVPVYNTEQYLCDCIKSVLKQTFTDFEVILIDDGSQDRSRNICEKMCERDKRIRLICIEHSGVSAARNIGIEAAKGKYVFFLDSDDMIHPQLLEALYVLQERNHTEIATVGLYYGKEGKSQKPISWRIENKYISKSCCLNHNTVKNPKLLTHAKTRLNAIGGKMILSKTMKIRRFDEKLTHGEDTELLYQMIDNGANVTVLLRKWYYYRQTKNSSCTIYSVHSCKSRYKAQISICDSLIDSGRLTEAVYTEWCILCEMVLWREMAKKNRDDKLQKYADRLIREEKKKEIFSKLDFGRKIIFYLGCVCYPLYKLIADILYWYHENLDIPNELRRKKLF